MSTTLSSYDKTTIVFPINGNDVLLGMKKRGFGKGWWNGFGGKLETGESYEECAVRETREEVGVQALSLRHVADLHFYFNDKLQVVSRAYVSDYTGIPRETDEMRPKVFTKDTIPYATMWPGDDQWIPAALTDTSLRGYTLYFDDNNNFLHAKVVDPKLLQEEF